MTKQKSVNQVKQDVNQGKDSLKDRSQSPILHKGQRILGQRVTGSTFDNKNLGASKEIGESASKDVHKNLDVQDELVKKAKRVKAVGYGIRTLENAKTNEKQKFDDLVNAIKKNVADYIFPNFTKATPVLPARSGLWSVPYSRYSVDGDCFVDDHTFKALYRKSEQDKQFFIGKEFIPIDQPIISHEFLEDVIFTLAEKNKQEWEVVPEITYDDKRGYRKYYGILSKRLDREIKGSFRINDVVRVGGLIHNGIAESTSVGFDMFTYCVTCGNGSVGRGKELGSESWKHVGKVEALQQIITHGLANMFEIGNELVQYYEKANGIPMTDEMLSRIWNRTGISNKYFEEAEDKKNRPYFDLIPEKENKRKIDQIKLAKHISLWEGYNALTQQVWHSDDLAFGKKAKELRKLNNELVIMVKSHKP